MQKKFTKFASVPAGSLAGNKDVQEQALVVMKKLGEIINAGDLKAATSAIAASHKARGVLLPDFKVNSVFDVTHLLYDIARSNHFI